MYKNFDFICVYKVISHPLGFSSKHFSLYKLKPSSEGKNGGNPLPIEGSGEIIHINDPDNGSPKDVLLKPLTGLRTEGNSESFSGTQGSSNDLTGIDQLILY